MNHCPTEQMFLHLDYKAHNLMYADGRVRLINPVLLQVPFYVFGKLSQI